MKFLFGSIGENPVPFPIDYKKYRVERIRELPGNWNILIPKQPEEKKDGDGWKKKIRNIFYLELLMDVRNIQP